MGAGDADRGELRGDGTEPPRDQARGRVLGKLPVFEGGKGGVAPPPVDPSEPPEELDVGAGFDPACGTEGSRATTGSDGAGRLDVRAVDTPT